MLGACCVCAHQEKRALATLETRQFTHRRGQKNPLFGPLDEDGRRRLLEQELVGEFETRPRLTSSGVPLRVTDLHAANNVDSNEVGAVRESRSQVGCACARSLNASKLPVRRLVEELRLRSLLPPPDRRGKKDLVPMLSSVLAEEGRCGGVVAGRCACADDGVPCHENVCGCCAKGVNRCNNPAGVYQYDGAGTKAYVRALVTDPSSIASAEADDPRDHDGGCGNTSGAAAPKGKDGALVPGKGGKGKKKGATNGVAGHGSGRKGTPGTGGGKSSSKKRRKRRSSSNA